MQIPKPSSENVPSLQGIAETLLMQLNPAGQTEQCADPEDG
jgi:hypothetical protein